MGYDCNYKNEHVGTVLLLKIIENLIEQQEIKKIDFGYMDSSYKNDYCNECWEETHFYIYRPTLKRFLINSVKFVKKIKNWKLKLNRE
jgi:CelD/BcsL family acetyltransferase involved in cellulose biosynthesis